MAEEFERIAFTCPVNVVQPPVKTDFGFHLVFVHRRSDVADDASKVMKINLRVLFAMPEGFSTIPNGILHSIVGETHQRCAMVQNLSQNKEREDFLVTIIGPSGIWRLDVGPPPNFQ